MTNYGNQQEVYNLIGVDDTQITPDKIDSYLNEADAEVERLINNTCKPRVIIRKFTGDNTSYQTIPFVPLLNIQALTIGTVTVSPKYLDFKDTGEIKLTEDAEAVIFSAYYNQNIIQYTYGWLENNSNVSQTVVSSLVVGSNDILVDDVTNYPVREYVKIEGIDGSYEVVKINSVNSTNSTINVTLYLEHADNSIMSKMQVPQIVVDLANTLAAIKGGTYYIGSTTDIASSFNVPDYSITKGSPYQHAKENLEKNIAQRDLLLSKITPWPSFA